MNCTRGRIAAAVAGAALAAVLIRACVARRGREAPDEGAASRISEADGVKVITLDTVAVKGSGIVSAPLAAAGHRKERNVFGEVLDPRPLPARAGDDFLISSPLEGEGQPARHRSRSGEAGGDGGGAVKERALCVRVSLSDADAASTPRSPARVTLPDGTVVAADPLGARAPGGGLVYRAPAGSSPPVPGTMLPVALPAGPEEAGYLIPDSAVVWTDGKAWVYMRRDGNRFSRREIAADTRGRGGWFVAGGFSPGEQVVVTGAQLLLSAEFLSQYALIEIAE
ncbi:MAG: hypothetical protein WCP22_04255 [Chlamydiota bacterium]